MILNEGSATTENVKFNSTDKYYTRDGRKYNATTEYLFPMDEGGIYFDSAFLVIY